MSEIKNPERLKMYILIPEHIPTGHAILASAHAGLSCFLEFKHTVDMSLWRSESFKKVVCKVTDEEFEKSKQFKDRAIMTESSLNGIETAIAFCPRERWPGFFWFLKLYK